MSAPGDCSQNVDPLKLVREGTTQDARSPQALDPDYVPVNEHGIAHNLVFARNYAALLKYFDHTDPAGAANGDWAQFFSRDVSVLLAVPAIEEIDAYTSSTQSWFDYLNEAENKTRTAELKERFGFLYGAVASLARRFDELKQALPADAALRGVLQNLIQTELAPAFRRLIAYYKAGIADGLVSAVAPTSPILGAPAVSFDSLINAGTPAGLSPEWSGGLDWAAYVSGTTADPSVYGSAVDPFDRINHCSTHTLFKAAFDQFLKVFARVVSEAKQAFDDTLTKTGAHEPHDALFLAFLRLLEYARSAGNTLTKRHLDFYYREILGLKEKGAEPAHAHLLVELAKQTASRQFRPGDAFKAGKDDAGKDAFFGNARDFVANQGKVAAIKTVYRHGSECVGGKSLDKGRLFASPAPDSDDGLGAPLTSADGSWHPFFNKIFRDGALTEIRMPKADVGFALASHHLLMAEGTRRIGALLVVSGYAGPVLNKSWSNFAQVNLAGDVTCLLTTEKGWLKKPPMFFVPVTANIFYLLADVDGGDPAIVPYSTKAHGYNFQTDQPTLLVTLNQDAARPYVSGAFQGVVVLGVGLSVFVDNLKSLAASNDFGPLDTSKPFQPFGGSPVAGSSFIIGSREIFQKTLTHAWITMKWLVAPAVHPKAGSVPNVALDFLKAGAWAKDTNTQQPVSDEVYDLTDRLGEPVIDAPDFTPNTFYGTSSRHGFVKLRLTGGFGQDAYQTDLIKFLRKDTGATDPGSKPPAGPTAGSLSMGYVAQTAVALNTADKDRYAKRAGRFFHVTPFGTAEQHPFLNGKGKVYLFPQFELEREVDGSLQVLPSEAEFYVGVSGLAPPQNLSLLFQVVDGTANPLAAKPDSHVAWSYLKQNEWVAFAKADVQDTTDALLNSGIVTLALPRDATKDNTVLPGGLYWIRAAVHTRSDAVCRLLRVAAQAMEAVFTDRGNSPAFSASPLPAGTISKLEMPDAGVKSISQPFVSFGGRGAEQSLAFFTRISERLRHKNRAITLWDYERLILDAFPQVYKVKCLNHTCYEPSETAPDDCDSVQAGQGGGIYRELAPGHVTIIAIPNLRAQNIRDPLKPFTSLGVLEQIKTFLEARNSCFATLHVKNPQFEEVRVRFSLRLHEGFDETYYQNLLKESITRFLSPWAFTGTGVPSFGGKIYKSVLINFVEEQPYVDYVTDFQLFHDIGGHKGTVDRNEVEGTRAVSVLVSVPAPKHEISIIKPAQDASLGENCLCDS